MRLQLAQARCAGHDRQNTVGSFDTLDTIRIYQTEGCLNAVEGGFRERDSWGWRRRHEGIVVVLYPKDGEEKVAELSR